VRVRGKENKKKELADDQSFVVFPVAALLS
jgi:hypothetical protein